MMLDAPDARGLLSLISALELMGDDRQRRYLRKHPLFARQLKRILNLYLQSRTDFPPPVTWGQYLKQIEWCMIIDRFTHPSHLLTIEPEVVNAPRL
jgi:hypothetical protein